MSEPGMQQITISSYPLPDQEPAAQPATAATPAQSAARAKASIKPGRQFTDDEILKRMSSFALRALLFVSSDQQVEYASKVAQQAEDESKVAQQAKVAHQINGTLISRWLADAWIDLARRNVCQTTHADASSRHTKFIVRGWPSFIKLETPNKRIFRRICGKSEAEQIVQSGRIFTGANSFMTMTPNGLATFSELTGALFAALDTNPDLSDQDRNSYVDFTLPQDAKILYLGMRQTWFHSQEEMTYLAPGPARINSDKVDIQMRKYLEHGRPLPPELQAQKDVLDRYNWTPPEVYIPVEVVGWGTKGTVKLITPSCSQPSASTTETNSSASAEPPAAEEAEAEAVVDTDNPVDAALSGGMYAFAAATDVVR